MSTTQGLLNKIAALRQRLEQAQGPTPHAAAVSTNDDSTVRLRQLERRVAVGSQHNGLLDGALRQLAGAAALPGEVMAVPTQLTARARRVVEQGRALLGKLRDLADEFDPDAAPDDKDPVQVLYQEAVAMTDTALRTVQALPDAPSVQLQLCKGLEAILGVAAERLATITAVVNRHRREAGRVETLANLLTALDGSKAADVKPFIAIAEEILAEAQQAGPLSFLHASPQQPARFVACHSLTVAQVVARVVRHDPDLRGRPLEPVLAALLHDAGMLHVPAAVLTHAGPLDDAQRRVIEGHTRKGAELTGRLLPAGAWLSDAVTGHHERLDGTGYPDGLRDMRIAPLTRLLAVCDVYVALSSPRPYRSACDTRTALTDTLLLAEQGTLDRYHAERLLHLSFYPVGSAVELADGAVGIVTATHAGLRDLSLPARPVVAVLTNAQGQPLPLPLHLDLAQCDGHSIVRSLPPAERRQLLGRRYPEWAA